MVLLDVELGGEPHRAVVLRGLEPVVELCHGDIVHTGAGSCHLLGQAVTSDWGKSL